MKPWERWLDGQIGQWGSASSILANTHLLITEIPVAKAAEGAVLPILNLAQRKFPRPQLLH
jgi:hypothetical protein